MFKKNTAVTGFGVHLVSASDGSDVTTGTPVGYTTIDGGTQTAIADVTPVHEGNGLWTFDLTAGEMNGDIVCLTFTHTDAVTANFTIKTEATAPDVNVAQINGSAEAASDLAASAATIVTGAAITGTLTTSSFTTDLTEATNDHYIGRLVIFTSGVLKDQATDITDYDGTTKTLTVTTMTEAPSNTDTFVIV